MSLSTLPPDVLDKALKELNENPDTRLDKIQELRDKIKTRPDLNIVDTTDTDLIRFLRTRKYDVERAFELLVAHYNCKVDFPEIFGDLNPSAEKKTFDSGWNIALEDRDQNGCKILVFRPGSWNPDERTLLNNFRANIIALEILLQDEITQINGIRLIVDFREFGLKQAKAMNPLFFRKYAQILFNFYPIRIKGIHILDQPAIFTVIFTIISQFMKDKVRKRVTLHGSDIEGLQQHVDKEILPSDYGGTNKPTDMRKWVKQVMTAEEEFEHLWT